MAISRIPLSGSTNGKNIKVVATATAGTTVHAAHATSHDEVYLYAYNSDTSAITLTLELGGTTDPDDLVTYSIPAQDGLLVVLDGHTFTGSVTVAAFAGTANKIVLRGHVNRIS